jgi:hypothetical protein
MPVFFFAFFDVKKREEEKPQNLKEISMLPHFRNFLRKREY